MRRVILTGDTVNSRYALMRRKYVVMKLKSGYVRKQSIWSRDIIIFFLLIFSFFCFQKPVHEYFRGITLTHRRTLSLNHQRLTPFHEQVTPGVRSDGQYANRHQQTAGSESYDHTFARLPCMSAPCCVFLGVWKYCKLHKISGRDCVQHVLVISLLCLQSVMVLLFEFVLLKNKTKNTEAASSSFVTSSLKGYMCL